MEEHRCNPDHDIWAAYDSISEDYFTCEYISAMDICTMDGTKGPGFPNYFSYGVELHELHDREDEFHALNCPQCGCVESGNLKNQ